MNIAIIGSTGSIGTQTLNVCRRYRDRLKVVALTAANNAEKLANQANEFGARFAALSSEDNYSTLVEMTSCETMCGKDSLAYAATLEDVDLVVVAVVGMRGLDCVVAAIKAGKRVALANKESLVAGGELVMNLVKQYNATLIPVDSEHSAVWQCLNSGERKDLRRIILTASGGAYFGKTRDELRDITPEQAVKHPNWNMGKKISVDSATMMNKGLEIIEARWLFDTQNIDYVVHKQSLVHSMVEWQDGSVVAQVSPPNMELPIQTALLYPDRLPLELPRLALDMNLTFCSPDEKVFSLPRVARKALEIGGNMPCVINAANEAAVELFLRHKIGFLDIFDIVENALSEKSIARPTFDDIYLTHKSVYDKLMTDNNK